MKSSLYFIPFFALLRREILRFLKVIYQTLATPLINTTLYLLVFGVSIGKEINMLGDITYLAFLIPGLVMMSALRNSFDNSTSSIVTSKFCGELEDLRMVPISNVQIAWAKSLGSLVRGVFVASLTLFIGLVFYRYTEGVWLQIHSPLALAFFVITGSLAFANLGLGVAMQAKTFEQVNAIQVFILLPLIYLGGVFFSLENLHPFWQAASKLNPLLYLVNGVRFGILGYSDVNLFAAGALSLLTFSIFYYYALWSLKNGSYSRW